MKIPHHHYGLCAIIYQLYQLFIMIFFFFQIISVLPIQGCIFVWCGLPSWQCRPAQCCSPLVGPAHPSPARQSQVWSPSPAAPAPNPTLHLMHSPPKLPPPSQPARPAPGADAQPQNFNRAAPSRWPAVCNAGLSHFYWRVWFTCAANARQGSRQTWKSASPAIKRKYVIVTAGEKVQTSNSLRWRRSFTRKHILKSTSNKSIR